MSLKHVYSWEGRHEAGKRTLTEPQDHIRRTPSGRRALSRRQAIRTMAGATGLILGSGALMPTLAHADGGADPRPIPGGIQPLGPGTELFHIVLPGPGAEPSLITDFNGFVARANIGGTGTGTDATGKTPLLFDVDAGFMQGEYVGVDGRVRRGAFAFIWLDIYKGSVDPDFNNQIHDFNPGFVTGGVFWTIPIPADSAQMNLGAGTASLKLTNVALGDYIKIPNSLTHGSSVPARASLEINWSGINNRKQLRDDANNWGGEFVETSAKITFSAESGGFDFTSAETNNQEFSIIGRERNGVYFHEALPLLS